MTEPDSLHRSKSYDSRFNELVSDASDTSPTDSVFKRTAIKAETSSPKFISKPGNREEEDEEQTKIIVTSFAPIPVSADHKRTVFEPANYFSSTPVSQESVSK